MGSVIEGIGGVRFPFSSSFFYFDSGQLYYFSFLLDVYSKPSSKAIMMRNLFDPMNLSVVVARYYWLTNRKI